MTELIERQRYNISPFIIYVGTANPDRHINVPEGAKVAEIWNFFTVEGGIYPDNSKPIETALNAVEGLQKFFNQLDNSDQKPQYVWGLTFHERTANFARRLGFDVIEHPNRSKYFGYFVCIAETNVVKQNVTRILGRRARIV